MYLVVIALGSSLQAQLWIVDPLEVLYPDSNAVGNWDQDWSADFIIDTDIAAHLLVNVPPNTPFSLTADIKGEQLTAQDS